MITAQCTGQVLEAKTATFTDDNGNDVAYGKVQLLVPDQSGQFHAIQNIKVKADNFGWIPPISEQKGKQVTLSLDMQTFKGQVSYYLAQPYKKTAQ